MTLPSPGHFVGREEALAAYDDLWSLRTPQRILNVEGISGTGKTTLLWYIVNHHDQSGRLRVTLDLGDGQLRALDHALLDALVDQLALPDHSLSRMGYYKVADRLDRQAAAIRGSRADIRIEQLAQDRGSIGSSPIHVSIAMNQRLADHRRAARHRLTRELLEVCEPLRGRECVLLLDTYEAVGGSADADFRAWLEEELLPGLLARWPGLRVVLAGREELPWRADQHRRTALQGWTRSDSDAFLAQWGVTDDALRKAIFSHCRGHPLLTDMAREVWRAGIDSGVLLTAADLLEGVDREAASEWLFKRLVERLPTPLGEGLRAAALLRRLSLEALNALLDEQRRLDAGAYQRLLRLSIIQRVPGKAAVVHDLLRQVEDARCRQEEPKRFRDCNERAASYYIEEPTGSTADVLYHMLAIDPVEGFRRWISVIDATRLSYDIAEQVALLEIAHLAERWRWLGSGDQAAWWLRNGLLAQYTDRLREAEAAYAAALALYQTVEDRLGEANTRKALGDLYVRTDRLRDAEAAYAAALALYQTVEARLGEANTHRSVARLRSIQERNDEAVASFADALCIYQSIEDSYSVAVTLTERGEHRVADGDPAGFADWGTALAIAAVTDEFLFEGTFQDCFSRTVEALQPDGRPELLGDGVPQLLEAVETTVETFDPNDEVRPNLSFVYGCFRLAWILSTWQIIVDEAQRDELASIARQEARELDEASNGALELSNLVVQVLTADR